MDDDDDDNKGGLPLHKVDNAAAVPPTRYVRIVKRNGPMKRYLIFAHLVFDYRHADGAGMTLNVANVNNNGMGNQSFLSSYGQSSHINPSYPNPSNDQVPYQQQSSNRKDTTLSMTKNPPIAYEYQGFPYLDLALPRPSGLGSSSSSTTTEQQPSLHQHHHRPPYATPSRRGSSSTTATTTTSTPLSTAADLVIGGFPNRNQQSQPIQSSMSTSISCSASTVGAPHSQSLPQQQQQSSSSLFSANGIIIPQQPLPSVTSASNDDLVDASDSSFDLDTLHQTLASLSPISCPVQPTPPLSAMTAVVTPVLPYKSSSTTTIAPPPSSMSMMMAVAASTPERRKSSLTSPLIAAGAGAIAGLGLGGGGGGTKKK